ncbi:RDD family protein [Streptomyces arboris]|uniref:RDD family protein n=1 Tax=Streptomyces arboris TaxID=2600619 RepID=A0A5N5EI06_9ACTN|nr:RDD family protein [Streptomyces arboris]KAB2589391.1 RDD family protein [Streptomyces arboris]
MSAPTPAPGDDSPREGYYPDPSIPGYVRYWNGASWVPGTSRPAPQQAAPAEETGPIFFDEEEGGLPDGTSGSADADRYGGATEGAAEGEAGSVWQADSARQAGFGGERDRRISWGGPAPEPAAAPADPRTPLAQDPTRGALPGMRDGGGAAEEAGARPPTEGTVTIRAVGPQAGAVQPNAVRGSAPRPDPVQPNTGTPQGPQRLPAAPAPAQPLPVPAPAPAPQEARQGPVQVPAAPAAPSVPTPLTPGPGGGSASWAQQVHQLAQPEQQQQQAPQHQPQLPHQQQSHPLPHQQQQPPFGQSGSGSGAGLGTAPGPDQPVVPWKPPAADDPFQQLVRAQAAARPAGLGKRFAARLVDNLVLGTVVGAVAIPLGTQAMDHIDRKITAAKQTGETVTVWLLDSTTGTLLGALVAAFLVLGFLLEALPTAKWGRTLGKKLFGLDVRDIESHDAPTLGAALRRWLVYGVLGLLVIGVVNVLWCLIDRPWRQCWHDKAARTFVAG